MRIKFWGIPFFLMLLTSCGGGGGGDGTTSQPSGGGGGGGSGGGSSTAEYKIETIKYAQAMVLPSNDGMQRMVGGKGALVEVVVLRTYSGATIPTVKLTVTSAAGANLGVITMTPPTVDIPTTAPIDSSLSRLYSANVSSSLIQPGVKFDVQMTIPNDNTGSISGTNPVSLSPKVDTGKSMEVVAIPIQVDTTTASIADFRNYLLARLPFTDVIRNDHAVYTSTTVTTYPASGATWSTEFSNLLDEVEQLRTVEDPSGTKFYYGFVPKRSWGLAGLGYLSANSAIGFDFPSQVAAVLETMVHELGHNLSLHHAPCGNPSGVDPSYPYTNAAMGSGARFMWGYNNISGAFIDPRNTTNNHDVMSYCTGTWFSDYNYNLIQKYVYGTSPRVALMSSADLADDSLLVHGRVALSGELSLAPLRAFNGKSNPPSSGPYLLRLITAQNTYEYSFNIAEHLDSPSPVYSFTFSVPNPGDLQGVQILKEGKLIKETMASAARYQGLSADIQGPLAQGYEKGGKLALTWDAEQYPYMMVTHIGAKRTVLAIELRGGAKELMINGLPTGGQFELSLSDGLNTKRLYLSR